MGRATVRNSLRMFVRVLVLQTPCFNLARPSRHRQLASPISQIHLPLITHLPRRTVAVEEVVMAEEAVACTHQQC